MEHVEYGIVVFFTAHNGKNYGFLLVLDDEGNSTDDKIFFHYNNGRFIGNDGWQPMFLNATQLHDHQVVRLAIPTSGQKIVFIRSEGNEGKIKAAPWGYAESWYQAHADLAAVAHDEALALYQAEV